MHEDLDFRPARETDLDSLGDVLSHAFGFPRDDAKAWFARAKLENVRVLERGSHVVGGLLEIPMGQYFGGRSVSTMGVAGVGVGPDERGRGVGTHMMVAMLREARARGFALSTLYPASVTLYRRAGYERAGARFVISLDPRTCEIPRVPEMTIAEVKETPEDVVALYKEAAHRCPGYLDRGPYVWARVAHPRGKVTKTFTASHGGKLEGYVVLSHTRPDGRVTTVDVIDVAATTARAGRALLRLLVEYRSLAQFVNWQGGPSDLFTNLLPERHSDVVLVDYFVVRVVDVARALTARGWPRGAAGSLTLDVNDASMPENSGRYAVTIVDGRAQVTKSDSGDVRGPRVAISERGLAALYTGYAQSHVLVESGWLEADADGQAQLDAWFGGPLPTMRDSF